MAGDRGLDILLEESLNPPEHDPQVMTPELKAFIEYEDPSLISGDIPEPDKVSKETAELLRLADEAQVRSQSTLQESDDLIKEADELLALKKVRPDDLPAASTPPPSDILVNEPESDATEAVDEFLTGTPIEPQVGLTEQREKLSKTPETSSTKTSTPKRELLKENTKNALGLNDPAFFSIFRETLAGSESGGKGYKAVGPSVRSHQGDRALGRYQFMPNTLRQLGLDDYANRPQEFLNNPAAQDMAFDKWTGHLLNKVLSSPYYSPDMPPPVMAGALWAGHIGGSGRINEVLKHYSIKGTQGMAQVGPSDGHFTTGGYFLKGANAFSNASASAGDTFHRNSIMQFANLDSAERARLFKREGLTSPHFARNSVRELDYVSPYKHLSTLGEVFKASHDTSYYTETLSGMQDMLEKTVDEAGVSNTDFIKKHDPQNVSGLLGAPMKTIGDMVIANETFSTHFPEQLLPYPTEDSVYALRTQRMKELEDKYEKLDSGGWFDNVGGFFKKMGHVLGGYLPGFLSGQVRDPASAIIAVTPLGRAKVASEAIRHGVGIFLAEGALQTAVQSERKEAGLEGGLARGAAIAAGAGVLTGALSAIGIGLGRLWKSGSRGTANALDDIADGADALKKFKKGELTPEEAMVHQKLGVKAREFAQDYRNNPHGGGVKAKVKFERNIKDAVEDIIQGKPVREMFDPPANFKPTNKALVNKLKSTTSDTRLDREQWHQAVRDWDNFKKDATSFPKVDQINGETSSFVPIVSNRDLMYFFKTYNEASNFLLKTKSGAKILDDVGEAVIVKKGEGNFYLAKSSDIEPKTRPSTRITEAEAIRGDDVVSIESKADVDIANKLPEHSYAARKSTTPGVRGIPGEEGPAPIYKKDLVTLAGDDYDTVKIANKDVEIEEFYRGMENRLRRTSVETPEKFIDVGEEGVEQITVSKFFKEIDEEKKLLKEFWSCMGGGS